MRECNICEMNSCHLAEDFRRNKSALTPKDLQRSCPRYIEAKVWKQPLVLCALVDHAQGVHDVLQSQEMFFQELAHRPYFRILAREMR